MMIEEGRLEDERRAGGQEGRMPSTQPLPNNTHPMNLRPRHHIPTLTWFVLFFSIALQSYAG
jgi:hypothetical protein